MTYAAEAVTADKFSVDFVLVPQLGTSAALFLELNSHLMRRMDDVGLCYLQCFQLQCVCIETRHNTLSFVTALHSVSATGKRFSQYLEINNSAKILIFADDLKQFIQL